MRLTPALCLGLSLLLLGSAAHAATTETAEPPREGWGGRLMRSVGLKRDADKPGPGTSPVAAPEASAAPAPSASPRPGFFRRAVGVLPFVSDGSGEKGTVAKSDRLTITAELDPASVSLAARRSLEVAVVLRNESKRAAVLSFPTGQRLELLLRGPGGQLLARWSEDQAFTQEAGYLAINPGERVEYRETLSLRSAKAAGPHTVEVAVVGRPDLARTLPLDVTR